MSKNEATTPDNDNLFSDISYICNSTKLIVDSLRRGMDIAQLPNGDVIITEVKTVNTQYTWDKEKNKMIKLAQL